MSGMVGAEAKARILRSVGNGSGDEVTRVPPVVVCDPRTTQGYPAVSFFEPNRS